MFVWLYVVAIEPGLGPRPAAADVHINTEKIMKIKKTQGAFGKKHPLAAAIICSAMIGGLSNQALAYTFDTGSRDWQVNLDTSIQYLVGMRAESRDKGIANSMGNHQSDYKFDRGDLVTNRLQTILEFQAVYQDRMGVR